MKVTATNNQNPENIMKTILRNFWWLAIIGLIGQFDQPVRADQIWAQFYDGFGGPNEPYGVAMDSAGNAIVTGNSVNASGTSDIYTVKYSASKVRRSGRCATTAHTAGIAWAPEWPWTGPATSS
jgi:hypothetical protein